MTKKAKLESYVQERFGTNLYEFIRQKVQVDHLYGYEIASLLGVSDSMITSLRNAYGIKRANGFSRRFDRRYGKGAVERFKAMAETPKSTLDDIGRYFGFSKEYARQVYKKIYGYAYTEAYKRKRLIRRKMGLSERTKRSKQFGGPTKVSKRTKSIGSGEAPILARFMTTKEVAKYLGLHKVTVTKYAAKGEIPSARIGRAWRFDKEAIDKWISEGQKKVTQKAKKVSTSDTDPNIIKKSRKGTRSATLKKKTEVKDDNQRPIIYKLRKEGKIKSERRGVYVKA
jgi:PTS system nitrogen regulatory IIA component